MKLLVMLLTIKFIAQVDISKYFTIKIWNQMTYATNERHLLVGLLKE